MIIRQSTEDDLLDINRIWRKHHSDFELAPVYKVVHPHTVEDEDGIIGAGYVEPILQVTVVLDLDRSPRERVQALRLLNGKAPNLPLHAFTRNDKWAEMLIKHMDFKDIPDRVLLRG